MIIATLAVPFSADLRNGELFVHSPRDKVFLRRLLRGKERTVELKGSHRTVFRGIEVKAKRCI